MQSVIPWLEESPSAPPEPGIAPCAFILLGASGDLARRKLLPALYQLHVQGCLPRETALIGAALPGMDAEAFRTTMREAIERAHGGGGLDPDDWRSFAQKLRYLPLDAAGEEDYRRLGALIEQVERECDLPGNRLFYLSLAPGLHASAVRNLGDSGLCRSRVGGWTRLVVEKPFGTGLGSARALNRLVHRYFDESDVYRMDHYLGKEMVQNLLFLRVANRLFESIWSREHVDHVRITCAETAGMEERGGYYEQTGVVRDMIQNHAFQLLSLVAMEPPADLSAEAVHDAKREVMASARPFTSERIFAECVRGQYGPGEMAGRSVSGYRQEAGVAPGSTTDTFALLTLRFETPRWAGVPFYVRSGKRLARNTTEVMLQLRDRPLRLEGARQISANRILFRIQPDEGIRLRLATRTPGRESRFREVELDWPYRETSGARLAEGYENLLLDCMLGLSTRYVREDLVEQTWELLMPVLESWAEPPLERFPNYAAGTWGPVAARRLLEARGHLRDDP